MSQVNINGMDPQFPAPPNALVSQQTPAQSQIQQQQQQQPQQLTKQELHPQPAPDDNNRRHENNLTTESDGPQHHGVNKGELYPKNEDFEEQAHGRAGRLVKKMGIWAYALFFVVPLVYVAIFFAIIPLGNPKVETIKEQWVFLFVSNLCVMIAMAYIYNAAFLSIAECDRPFRTSIIPLIGVSIGQIIVMTPILLAHGVFPWIGLIALVTFYISLFVSMFFAYTKERQKLHSFFRRFMVLFTLYIPILSGFVISYRETDSSIGQVLLSISFALITFVYRRIMLSRLDPFPLEYSQLFSGFWVQNLGDCTSILALPQVNSPSVLIGVFVANSAANVSFLVFVSDLWIYKIRPYLKTYVKNAIICNFPLPPIPEPDESFDARNRGHDYNTGGYRRRQFRFFFFRLLSQAVAMFFYLGISPMLRFGVNREYTPLADNLILGGESVQIIKQSEYRNSMIYAAMNLVFILCVAALGYFYLNKSHHETFQEIRQIHKHDFVHHTMVGEITAIITHNMIMTIAIILSHYCIFTSSSSCVISRAD